MFKRVISFLFIAALFWSAPCGAWDWSRDAVRLTGESDYVREQALNRLKKRPDLENILRQQLRGPKQPLALDVISALDMVELLPDLLQVAKKDENGFVYLAINNLMNSENKNKIVSIYEHHLFCPASCQASGPAQVVILDTLSRLGESFSPQQIESLLASPWPEVRFSALNYVRTALLKRNQGQYLHLVKQALHGQPLQLREQALYLASELTDVQQKQILASMSNCQNTFGPTARVLCEKLKPTL